MPESIQTKVDRYLTQEAPDTNLLPPKQVLALALAAVRKYTAYGELAVQRLQREAWEEAFKRDASTPRPQAVAIDKDLMVIPSEWAVISDLWSLYMERDQAKQMEASRGLGVDAFGRASSEIEADIRAEHEALPMRAFWFGPFTV